LCQPENVYETSFETSEVSKDVYSFGIPNDCKNSKHEDTKRRLWKIGALFFNCGNVNCFCEKRVDIPAIKEQRPFQDSRVQIHGARQFIHKQHEEVYFLARKKVLHHSITR